MSRSTIHRGLELAQICWVVPDIHIAVKFFKNALGVVGFPTGTCRARTWIGPIIWQDGGRRMADHAGLAGTFMEFVQPVSDQNMFHGYLARYPTGGTQHMVFRLPIRGSDRVSRDLRDQGYEMISEVDHPLHQ
jgi:methylmalonyl-CoA/ethylmalonyl-CoA epimerase